MHGIILRWKVENKDHHCLLRDYLRNVKEISRQALTAVKQHGELRVNDEEVTVRALLHEGDEVTVVFPPEERSDGMEGRQIPLSIVYEDEHILVINKQPNLPTIPSIYHPNRSLANGVLYYYDVNNIPSTFHAVNRLDRDTSGLLIIAKHRYAHDLFSRQQKLGKVKRTYLAVVHNIMERIDGTINAPIGRKEDSIIEREVRKDGQEAVTNFKVIRYLKKETVVRLILETGRTHQIRVHMASIGHPLLGDDLYGGSIEKISRQALHSWKLQFFHPFLQRELNFSVEPPEDMNKLINEL
ncbi:RNA pseudouridine synthase [Anaerobacillus alkalidiazotrophicus]|uniref:Pseudouridine synthase n=1 Tax=Anaerobacillus alkalidiazotrophicus TaxID=472963 RepID=A0A1S2M5F8_9BACI|nr:RluA family pseudouridine synthase [Anaerobacillus alkalidiazotrophicus]OIJ18509.1 RNA pseudouridine synthase [Anaerobacillus alkalidiazotrophicus]OIJ19988.1 RNA pseudouridine synthase [Anaerobacillus alkalidiazotrophicus]